jgi:hypothetical protein
MAIILLKSTWKLMMILKVLKPVAKAPQEVVPAPYHNEKS